MSVRFHRRSSRIQSSPVAAVPAADTPAEKWARALTPYSEQGLFIHVDWDTFKDNSISIDARPVHVSNVEAIARNMLQNGLLPGVIYFSIFLNKQ
jgi:hypothetical protein